MPQFSNQLIPFKRKSLRKMNINQSYNDEMTNLLQQALFLSQFSNNNNLLAQQIIPSLSSSSSSPGKVISDTFYRGIPFFSSENTIQWQNSFNQPDDLFDGHVEFGYSIIDEHSHLSLHPSSSEDHCKTQNLDLNAKRCQECQTEKSPEWRKGPNGVKTLCNACGLRFARKRAKLSEQK